MTEIKETSKAPCGQGPQDAKRHIVSAWTAWQERTRETDTRDYCSGSLRRAAACLAGTAPELARKCGDCAARIETFGDFGRARPVQDDIAALRAEAWKLLTPPWGGPPPAKTPPAPAAAAALPKASAPVPKGPEIPLVIPLKPDESYEGRCDELRLLLRSIEANVTGLARVCIVSDTVPDWLNTACADLAWLPLGNPYTHNKDANLFLKVQKAIAFLDIKGKWAFSADDTVFLKKTDMRDIPVIYNGTTRGDYAKDLGNKWHRRMIHTMDYLRSRGIDMAYSYDCHVPQIFDAATITERLKGVPYGEDPGFCIYTLWRGLEGKNSGDVFQASVVNYFGTAEDGRNAPLDKSWITYTDTPFGGGLRDRLYRLFPSKSRFEK